MEYRLPEAAREFALFQRTALLPKRKKPRGLIRILHRLGLVDSGYQAFVREYAAREPELIDRRYFGEMQSRAEVILPHIPRETEAILDIGCGIEGLDLFLYSGLFEPKLHLLDKSATETNIWYNLKENGAFYNSLELAQETLTSNGVKAEKIELLEAPSDGRIGLPAQSIDLVVSTISWGFHYPVKTYARSVSEVLSVDGVLIMDILKGTGGERDLSEFFDFDVIDESPKLHTVRARLKPIQTRLSAEQLH